jgi:hypothetical protein
MVEFRMNKKESKKDKIIKKFEGKKITLVKYSFLPKNTVALSAELFNELKKGDK